MCNGNCDNCKEIHKVSAAHMCYDKKFYLPSIIHRTERHQYMGQQHLLQSYDSLPANTKVYKIIH